MSQDVQLIGEADSTKDIIPKKRKRVVKDVAIEGEKAGNLVDVSQQVEGLKTLDECLETIGKSLLLQTVIDHMVKRRVILPNILLKVMGDQLFNVNQGDFEGHIIPSTQDIATHIYQKIVVPYATVKKVGVDFTIQLTIFNKYLTNINDFRKLGPVQNRKTFVHKMMTYTDNKFLKKLIDCSNDMEKRVHNDAERNISSSISWSLSSSTASTSSSTSYFPRQISSSSSVKGERGGKVVADLYNYKTRNIVYVGEIADKLLKIMKNPKSI